MGSNKYKGIVSYELSDGSKTVTERKFNSEHPCNNWVLDGIVNVFKHYSDVYGAPNSIIGEVIGGGKHVTYNIGSSSVSEVSKASKTSKANKVSAAKTTANNGSSYPRRVYMFWNSDTRSILGTLDVSITSELERNGWVKLYHKTPRIGTNYFNRCVNWLVAEMATNGNYKITKVDYQHRNNNPDEFRNFIRSIM